MENRKNDFWAFCKIDPARPNDIIELSEVSLCAELVALSLYVVIAKRFRQCRKTRGQLDTFSQSQDSFLSEQD